MNISSVFKHLLMERQLVVIFCSAVCKLLFFDDSCLNVGLFLPVFLFAKSGEDIRNLCVYPLRHTCVEVL